MRYIIKHISSKKKIWISFFEDRNWLWWSSSLFEKGFKIVISLSARDNYVELLSILIMLGVKHKNIIVNDDYFGEYKLHESGLER